MEAMEPMTNLVCGPWAPLDVLRPQWNDDDPSSTRTFKVTSLESLGDLLED